MQEASAHYLAHTRDERSAAQRQEAADDLVGWFEQLAAYPVLDDRPSLEILREIRGDSLGDEGDERGA